MKEKLQIQDLLDNYNLIASNINQLLDELSKEQSDYDLKVSDILHFITFDNYTSAERLKIFSLLKNILLERVEVKNNLRIIQCLKTAIGNGSLKVVIDDRDDLIYKYKTDILKDFGKLKDSYTNEKR